MKKVLLAIIVVGFAASTLAQGNVIFLNLNSALGLRAPVFGVEAPGSTVSKVGNTSNGLPVGTTVYNGVPLSGSSYLAALLAAPGANQPDSALQAAIPVTTFRTGVAAGYVNIQTATLANVGIDAQFATIQLVVWDNSSGLYSYWASAYRGWQSGLIAAGRSLSINVSAIGGNLNAPPLLTGLQSFNLYYVPEPSTFALVGLGAAALLFFRRPKSSKLG